MVLSKRIDAFAKLGELMLNFSAETETTFSIALNKAVRRSCAENGWYTEALYHTAIENIGKMLSKQAINQWLEAYKLSDDSISSKNVAIIMAGNIPLVGFHDFLCVLIAGNSVLAKLSHNDKCVLPVLADMLIRLEPEFATKIKFTESKLENFDAVIATGNNNSARYFDYYFKNYPHIIRQNRNSIAVLDGNETDEQLRLLGNDMFQYFGLGCRNVSKLFLPKGLNLERLFVGIDA
ncbi:MAG: acyl-CoA reductase, partial [Paludibacter sp.]